MGSFCLYPLILSDESAGQVAELDPAGVSGETVRGTVLVDTN